MDLDLSTVSRLLADLERGGDAARSWLSDLLPLRSAAPAPGPGEPYGRRVLVRAERVEVLLMGWRRGGRAAPHDHGEASGHVLVLDGSVIETSWGWREGDLVPGDERRGAPGDALGIGAGAIHDLRAPRGAVTLHLYTPVIHGMRVFDRDGRETLRVADSCGAWIPRRPGLVVDRQRWAAA